MGISMQTIVFIGTAYIPFLYLYRDEILSISREGLISSQTIRRSLSPFTARVTHIRGYTETN